MAYSWTPKYLNITVSNKSKQAIDADYWNALWNAVIAQADNNTEGLQYVIENLVLIDWDQIAELIASYDALTYMTLDEVDALFEG